jgi:hypothetical protein
MKNLLSIFAISIAVTLSMMSLSTDAFGQKDKGKGKTAKTVDIKSTRGDATRGGADKNIKQGEMANDPKAKIDAPAAKGGGTTRGGGGCRVEMDNSTSWYVKVYVDGIFRGTMDPWGDSYVYVYPGDTTIYARADFTDGSYKYWGPRTSYCGNGDIFPYRMLP